jgi:hypothetical protein
MKKEEVLSYMANTYTKCLHAKILGIKMTHFMHTKSELSN